MEIQSQRYHPWLHRFACLTAVATFFLLIAGASVTSNRAGLAVPDWLTAYGEFLLTFPRTKWVGGIFYEHGHRLIAYTVGALTAILAIWLAPKKARVGFIIFGAVMLLGSLAAKFARPEDSRYLHGVIVGVLCIGAGLVFLRRPATGLGWWGFAALLAVLAQATLGGLTVVMMLPPEVSIAHACFAKAFFCLTIAIAFFTSRRWNETPRESSATTSAWLQRLAWGLVAAVFVQLFFGATLRHAEAGEWCHIIGAGLVTALTIALCVVAFRQRMFRAGAASLVALLAAQITLGIITLVVRVPKSERLLDPIQIYLPTIHHAVGALILAVSFSIALLAFRSRRSNAPTLQRSSASSSTDARSAFAAYFELTKPRIVLMVLITAALGYVLGGGFQNLPLLFAALLGIGLTTGGSAVLNNYLEREVDAKMERTKNRALPLGLIAPSSALSFGIALVLVGVLVLALFVNLLTAFLVLLAAFLYAIVYTPMKRLTWMNTTFGAIPGALPPMCGWAAATGRVDAGAWVLFAILFAWQHPHFFAIAWMFRDDYRNAGFKMLPVVDSSGRRMFRQNAFFSLLLIGLSVLPTTIGMTGQIYFYGALALGAGFFAVGMWMAVSKTHHDARRLLKASVLYLPLLCGLMMFDKL